MVWTGRLLAQEEAGTLTIESRILGRTRSVFVSTPDSHRRTQRTYPVIILLDGEFTFQDGAQTARRLARLGHIPEAIVLGIPNHSSDPRDRVRDMTPPGLSVSGSTLNEDGEKFLDFIERELLPEITKRYRGGRPNVIVGWSSGGVISTYAAATRAAFPVVVAIDAPIFLAEEWLARKLIERAKDASSANVPVRYVSVQAQGGWSDLRWKELEKVAPGNWLLHRERLELESHESVSFIATYVGLKFAFADYSIVGAPLPPRAPASKAFAHYESVATSLGSPDLPPPAPALGRLVFDLLVEGLVGPARRALQWTIDGYGDTSEESRLKDMIARVEKQPPLKETVSDLLRTPPPAAQEIAPYVGTWSGTDGPNENARSKISLRIRVENGRGIAEGLEPDPTGAMRWRRLEYLKVLPDGVEWGRMNGMRPLGVWVNTGQLDNGKLVGRGGFRGIVIPLPDGRTPPVFTFELQRQ